MIKKIHMLTYFIVVFSLFSIGYTGSYFSDMETSIGNTFIAGTWPTCPPYKPTNPNPENNATDIELNPMLNVYVSDPNNDTMNVSFYDASDDSLIDTVTNIESDTMVSVVWPSLDYGVTYEWYAVAEDYEGPAQSDTWRFTTNHPSPPSGGSNSGGGSSDGGNSGGSPPSNNPPTAIAGGPYYGNISEPTIFNGSNSLDPDGIIVSFYWDFGDGTNITETNTTITHQYTDIGTYTVTLTVTDDDGAVDTNTTTVTITSFLEINNISATPNPQNPDEYVNITCILTSTSEITDVVLNITHPDNSTSNVTMTRIDGPNLYYYNSTYSDMGDYTFFISASDTNNTAISNIYHFSIVDIQLPEILDNTPETAYKNETFTFNATVTDNIQVSGVWVEYWYETENHTNISMNNIDEDSWNKTITIPSNFDILHYIIHAKDTSNNWNHTEIKSIILEN